MTRHVLVEYLVLLSLLLLFFPVAVFAVIQASPALS